MDSYRRHKSDGVESGGAASGSLDFPAAVSAKGNKQNNCRCEARIVATEDDGVNDMNESVDQNEVDGN